MEYCDKLILENKEMTQNEAKTHAGIKWMDMPEEEKASFEAQARKDTKRFNKQTAEIDDQGYFMLEDGRRSCDIKMTGSRKSGAALSKQKSDTKQKRNTGLPKTKRASEVHKKRSSSKARAKSAAKE